MEVAHLVANGTVNFVKITQANMVMKSNTDDTWNKNLTAISHWKECKWTGLNDPYEFIMGPSISSDSGLIAASSLKTGRDTRLHRIGVIPSIGS